ncbi:Hypothetical protein CAP_3863 [Chondromyces apiculatus DSM 436]|uniref:Uncharacterized protein n=1 Tax=Chondromyces apiculatus DSM 436 TaxID=1192034 RepID=A0A017T737_9BACT|nr:Hypothetical protein CAP_3863 [Chondromyces apiculatus DSM 436]
MTTDALRRATLTLLAHLDATGQREMEIEEDFYWNVPADQRYDPYEKPEALTLGQLSDDGSEIQRILAGEREPTGLAMVWLATILRRVGEKSRE